MSFPSAVLKDAGAAPIAMRARRDLHFDRQSFMGETYWIARDPLRVKFVRLTPEEYLILNLLDGKISLIEIKQALEKQFPEKCVRTVDLQRILGVFHRSGLTLADADDQGAQLFQRQQRDKVQRVFKTASNILWLRFRGVDPERFLQATYPYLRWLFHPLSLLACVVLMLAAAGVIVINLDDFYRQLPAFNHFFTARNAVLLAVSVAITKILHELGHAYACKHFGGECHQIGLLLLILVPCLYCNTSDAWRLSNKWHRAAIGMAGIFVELTLAAGCTFVWWTTRPGVLHYLCLNVMFTSSISTVVFNGNPLLKYDGYYVLSDLVEVPNLATRSRTALVAVLRTVCLGMPWSQPRLLPRRGVLPFALYSLASTLYRWIVLLGVLIVMTSLFKPYGMQAVGHVMIGVTLCGLVVMPLIRGVKYLLVPGRIRQMKVKRVSLVGGILAAVVAFVCLVRLPCHVYAPVRIKPAAAEAVYVTSPGRVTEAWRIEPGSFVEAGTVLAKLQNDVLELEIAKLQAELAEQQTHRKLLYRTYSDAGSSEQIPATEQAITDLKQRVSKRQADYQRLALVAPRDGHVLPPPPRSKPEPSSSAHVRLATWSGLPMARCNTGCFLDVGELFCHVGDPKRMKATVTIPQEQIKYVARGQSVQVKLNEYPSAVLHGQIEEIATIDQTQGDEDWSSGQQGQHAGDSPAADRTSHAGVRYRASIPLKESEFDLLIGYRGQAKIRVPDRTLGDRLIETLWSAFRF